MIEKLGIFVFSFNRGQSLSNCIKSIEVCAPGVPVCIIDDGSTDPDTLIKLARFSQDFEIFKPDAVGGELKTGGLYGNMNLAMEIARDRGMEYSIFIQDDMQFVRSLGQKDFDHFEEYFSCVPNSIQLSTAFIRDLSSDTFLDDHIIDVFAHAYIRQKQSERGKSNFSATGVFSVARFIEHFGKFEIGEGQNSKKAINLGLVCGRAIFPNICWLPYPNSFRGKSRSLKHKFFEIFGKSGYYPINFMSPEEEAFFLNRDPKVIPVMERFLVSPTAPRQDIWSTGGGEYNFIVYNSFVAKIYKALRSGKRAIKRLVSE